VAPVTNADPAHSRQGRYRLLDPFFRFRFRFVYREHVHLEQGDAAPVRQTVSEHMDAQTQIDVAALDDILGEQPD
jgi:hypothetical protein